MKLSRGALGPEVDMSELQLAAASEVVPYERGVERSSVLRAVLTRFIPASAMTVGAAFWLLGTPANVGFLTALAGVVAPLAVGFGIGLEGLRRWLYPDAEVDGRRSVIAGVLSPVALFIFMTLGITLSMAESVGLGALVGVLIAVIMFFAWLTPTPEEMRSDHPTQVDDAPRVEA